MTTQRQDTKSKRGLGRGLGAIFDVDASDAIDARDERVVELDIHQLIPNRDQPRQDFDEEKLDELARSIRDQGVISPLIVTPADTPDHYMIVAGERRWRAAQRAELKRIPVIIRDLETADVQRQALIDNVVREDLNAIEEAQAIQRLMDEHHMTQAELASALGKSRPAISNTLRLLNLPDTIQDLVRQGDLSPGHARALLALSEAAQQRRAATEVLARQLSVRDTERLVRDINEPPAPKTSARSAVDEQTRLHIEAIEERLRRALGTRVTLDDAGERGKITIHYHSADERERLLELLEEAGA